MKVEITILPKTVWVDISGEESRLALPSIARHLRAQGIPLAFACDIVKTSVRVDIFGTVGAMQRDLDAAFAHVVGAVCVWANRMRAEIIHAPSPQVVWDREWVLAADEAGEIVWRKQ